MLLQVLDDGRLTDAKGRVINFKNTIIIMTSNIGSQHIQKMQTIGFSDNTVDQDYQATKDRVMESLKDFFRPEFLNRLDDLIVFDVLPKEVIKDIVHLRLSQVLKRMQSKGFTVDIRPSVIEFMTEKGYDPQFGARPLNRLIQNTLLNRLSTMIIGSEVGTGNTVVVDMKKDEMVFEVKKRGLTISQGKSVKA